MKQFWRTFKTLRDKGLTPYMHAVISHVPSMLATFGSLRQFSTSAQKLKNSVQTIVQFRGTNQKNIPRELTVHQLTMLWFSTQEDVRIPLPLKRMKNGSFPTLNT